MYKIFLLLLVFFLIAFTNGDKPVVISNSGINGIEINKSDLKAVKKEFPGGSIKKKIRKKMYSYACLRGGGCMKIELPRIVWKTYSIDKKGISFKFCNDKLINITVSGKHGIRTSGGIRIGESTFYTLDTTYGYKPWEIMNGKLRKTHGKMIFECALCDENTQPDNSLIIDQVQLQ